jgi:hypothetical protein
MWRLIRPAGALDDHGKLRALVYQAIVTAFFRWMYSGLSSLLLAGATSL